MSTEQEAAAEQVNGEVFPEGGPWEPAHTVAP
jgi:hypothetical protein